MGLWCVKHFSLNKFAAWGAMVVVCEQNLRMHQRAETGVHRLSERNDAGMFDYSWPGVKELYLHHQMLNPGCSINT